MSFAAKIGFVGSGNMARALIGGLRSSGVAVSEILCYDPDSDRLNAVVDEFKLKRATNNQTLVDQSDVVILAVKPQALQRAISEFRVRPTQAPLFLTIAAGIRTAAIRRWLGADYPIVRAMPNTPALVRAGATGMFATPDTSPTQRELAESILRAVGLALWVDDESQLDAVTALSGSGPAYFFYLMEAMEKAALKLGLPQETARLLTLETAFGAAKLALEVEEQPAVLRQRVTSPGGTTERAIAVFDQQRMHATIEQALQAARQRANELAEQLEQ